MSDNKTQHVPLVSNACACLLTGVCVTLLSEWDWVISGHDFSTSKTLVFPLVSALGMYGAHFFKMMGIKASLSREEKALLKLHDKKISELKGVLSDPFFLSNFTDAEKIVFKEDYINALRARTSIIDGKIVLHQRQYSHFENEAEVHRKTSPLNDQGLEAEIENVVSESKPNS
ncbi:hypothetical protein [Aeromonas salmonicida]|jgi:hypothetical protein